MSALLFSYCSLKMLSGAAFSSRSMKKCESLVMNARLGQCESLVMNARLSLLLRLVAVSLSFGGRGKASREVEMMWMVSINSIFFSPSYRAWL